MVKIIISYFFSFCKRFDDNNIIFFKIIYLHIKGFAMDDIYMLGIGGVSMSALAVMLKAQGFGVRGYDERNNTKILKEQNISVDFHLNEEELKKADVVVYSSAIKPDNPQMILTKSLKKRLMTRGELLGWVAERFEKVIAVAGSHGKTTTTALIFEIMSCAGLNPTLHLGGYRVLDGKNFYLGGQEFFVTEACEYHDNFLNLHPYISVITNIEKEHMDYFKTFSNQLRSFEKFKKQSKFVVDDFGEIRATKICHDKNGHLIFSLVRENEKIMRVHLQICEEINTQNCIYAYLVCKKLGISDCIIKQGLESFKGVQTRFEKMRCRHFDTCICDYAHHPTEISKAISTAKKVFKDKTLVTIFQPHTYSRTKDLLQDFIAVFEKLEQPIFFKTYSARESPKDGISAEEFTKILQKTNKNAKYFENFEDLRDFLLNFSKTETALLFLGAGDLPDILHKNSFIE